MRVVSFGCGLHEALLLCQDRGGYGDDKMYQQMFAEMRWPHFRGLWSLLTVWGEKQT